MKLIRLFITIIFLLSLSITATLAKGTASKITITGPGLAQMVDLTDPVLVPQLSFGSFEDFQQPLDNPPANLGEGYELTRYFENGERYDAFDHVHYYPAGDGVQSYVYYDGIINGSSEYDGEWFHVTAEGEHAMQAVLQQYVRQDVVTSRVLIGHTGPVTDLVWSPDGSLLASRSEDWEVEDFTARIWRADGTPVAVLNDHTCQVLSLAWSPDGQTLASGSCDMTIRLWKPDGTPIRTIEANIGSVYALAWSPDGKILASGSLGRTDYNVVQWWDSQGNLLKTLQTNFSGGKFYRLAWSPDGHYLVGGAIDYTEWTADGIPVFSHESCAHCTPAWGFAWSPDSQRWAIGNESGLVWVYNTAGDLLGQLQNNGNVDVMAFSPDGNMLLGGNSIWTWNGSSFDHPITINSGRIAALSWSPDGSEIASSAIMSIRVTEAKGNVITTLDGHKNQVRVLVWSPDGRTLASGSNDKTIRLWDVSNLIAEVDVLTAPIEG